MSLLVLIVCVQAVQQDSHIIRACGLARNCFYSKNLGDLHKVVCVAKGRLLQMGWFIVKPLRKNITKTQIFVNKNFWLSVVSDRLSVGEVC